MIQRFFYNPDNGKLTLFNCSHVEAWQSLKQKTSLIFDDYIRGIITNDNKILLRVYYPFPNIYELEYSELLLKSKTLINLYLTGIKKALICEGINIQGFILNVTNEDCQRILNLQYV